MQCRIIDWPAFLSLAGAAKSSIGAEEAVVRLALPHVLRRGFVPFPCGYALLGVGAASTEAAANATKPTNVGMITRISASFLGRTVRRCADVAFNRTLIPSKVAVAAASGPRTPCLLVMCPAA